MATELTAGLLLDRRIYSRVFGVDITAVLPFGVSIHAMPLYSTTWEGAGLVVERMRALGFSLGLDVYASSQHPTAEFTHKDGRYAREPGDTPPEAICRAALAVQP